jgi:hypothetical protein
LITRLDALYRGGKIAAQGERTRQLFLIHSLLDCIELARKDYIVEHGKRAVAIPVNGLAQIRLRFRSPVLQVLFDLLFLDLPLGNDQTIVRAKLREGDLVQIALRVETGGFDKVIYFVRIIRVLPVHHLDHERSSPKRRNIYEYNGLRLRGQKLQGDIVNGNRNRRSRCGCDPDRSDGYYHQNAQ